MSKKDGLIQLILQNISPKAAYNESFFKIIDLLYAFSRDPKTINITLFGLTNNSVFFTI